MFSSLLGFISISLLAATPTLAAQNSLQQVTNFGSNPTNVGMFVYKPTGLVAKPALVVAIHACHGTDNDYFVGTNYANMADQMKTFMLIYPNAPGSDGCWDVHTNATLTHNAGGDSLGIASMVRFAIANYGVDASRVFATGTSSGGMMTNVLMGSYPDLFRAGSAFCGVAFGCFAGVDSWNTPCADGQVIKTPQQWGAIVHAAYPSFTGARPKMQVWHGTVDQTLNFNNFGEEIKEWTNVLGYSQTPATTQQNSPLSGWTRYTYGANFQAISAQGVDHNIQAQPNDVLTWFGLLGAAATTTPAKPPSTTATPPPSSTAPAGATQTHYGQCGGTGWTGPKVCASPYTCQVSSVYYSQCL